MKVHDLKCLGCGKRLKNFANYQIHAKRCKELVRVIQVSYNIPTVNIKDLTYLEAKQLPNSKDWGIWNTKANDWVRDKADQIDSRVFERNIKSLLSHIIAASITTNAPPEPSA
jgi:hypothetical protein